MVSKEAEVQGHVRVTKYTRTNYIALNLPYYYRFSFFCSSKGHKRDHILSHFLFTIRKMEIVGNISCRAGCPYEHVAGERVGTREGVEKKSSNGRGN